MCSITRLSCSAPWRPLSPLKQSLLEKARNPHSHSHRPEKVNLMDNVEAVTATLGDPAALVSLNDCEMRSP